MKTNESKQFSINAEQLVLKHIVQNITWSQGQVQLINFGKSDYLHLYP